MTEGELITRVMAYTENVDPQDLDYQPRRRRILAWCQEIWDEVWQAAEWPWKRARATITVASGDYDAPLPADFGNIPAEGGVFAGGYRLEDVSQFFTAGGREAAVNPPTYSYSIYNFSTTSQRGTIQFPSAGPSTLIMHYNRKPPQLADEPWDGTPVVVADAAAGNPNGTYFYVTSYITEDGYEHHESEPATTVTVVSKKILVTFPEPGPLGEHNVQSINLYRTTATGDVFYLVTNADDPTYLDDTSDAALVLLPPLVSQNVLNQVPSQYHHTVLLSGVISRSRRSKGDTRDWEGDYERGLMKMINQERQRKSAIQRTPRSIYGMW